MAEAEVDGSCEALIVATERYDDQELRRLRLPAQDAGRLAEVVGDAATGGFAVRSVIDQPTAVVTRAIQRFFNNRQPTDLLLLYISCHAIMTSRGGTYFAASNTQRRRLEGTAISAGLLNHLIDQSQARETILMLDCCHSRVSSPGSNHPDTDVVIELAGPGHTLLTSSTAVEYTWTGDQLTGQGRSSRFTGAVIAGLRNLEADHDGDGLISVRDLYHYLSRRGVDAQYHRTLPGPTTDIDVLLLSRPAGRVPVAELGPEDGRKGATTATGGVSAAATSDRTYLAMLIVIAAGLPLFVGAVLTSSLIGNKYPVPRAGVPTSTPVVSVAPSATALMLSRIVTVPGTKQWTDTGVDLEPGQQIIIETTGRVQHAPAGPFVGPDGDDRPELRQFSILPDSPHVAVIGKVNTDGQPFPVGGSLKRIALEKGRLFLGVNDKDINDNSGEFTARIEVRRG